VKSFIREESLKIDSMLKDNLKRKSLKDVFFNNSNYEDEQNSMSNRNKNNII